MLLKKTTVAAGVLLAASALAAGLSMVPRHAGAVEPSGGQREDEAIAELKKRVAQLETEVAEIRKALLRAGGGTPDSTTEIKNVTEVAKLRAADLLQRAQNTHDVLREVMNGKLPGQALLKINDLMNDLSALWFKLAGYGLGRDPYLDNITVSNSGFSRATPAPDFGIRGPYVSIGMPRLHERFLEASGVKGAAAQNKTKEFKKLVKAYSNPGVYRHRDFGKRAYNEYRQGKGLDTPQFGADLKAMDQWLTDLEAVLEKVPTYFDKAP